jgi:hypothetical protein
MRTRVIDRTRFVGYRDRAGEFFLGMNEEAELGRFNAAALLGIHAAIALSDAVVAHKVGIRSADENHATAVRLLKDVCQVAGVDSGGAKRLGEIISRKNHVAYSDKYVAADTDEVQRVRRDVERFFTWAYRSFGSLRPEPIQGG